MIDWRRLDEYPAAGRRIVALYQDGGGAALFLVEEDGLLDEHGSDDHAYPFNSSTFSCWAYVPDNFRLFFEKLPQ